MTILNNTLSGILSIQQKTMYKLSGISSAHVKFKQNLPIPNQKNLNQLIILTKGVNQGYIYRCDFENEQYKWTDITPAKGQIPSSTSQLINDSGYITSANLTGYLEMYGYIPSAEISELIDRRLGELDTILNEIIGI